ncbi:MAG: restriction endonuclease subunit S [Asticcacaulis sp.]|nr:restriction endonuclease subunit S [Asticcacaulis sp.]
MSVALLSEIAEQLRGVSYGKSDVTDHPADGYIPVLRANNITDVGLALDDLVYVRSNKVASKQKIKSGDIVIAASSGSISVVGKAAQAEFDLDAGFGAFCKVVRPSEKVNARYLGHFFKTSEYRQKMSTLAAGANINNLKNEHIDDLLIPLPPLDEQKRIAAILDQADALRRLRQRSLDRLNTLSQAIFYEMFGDPATNPLSFPTRKASEMAKRITVGIVVRPASYYVDTGVPVIRGTNIKSSGIDLSDVVYFSEQDNATRLAKTRVWAGDLVIVRTGRPGLAAVVPPHLDGTNTVDVLILSPDRNYIFPRFFRDLINSEGGKKVSVGRKSRPNSTTF